VRWRYGLILRGRDLSEFELEVAGYQVPGFAGDIFDANWLIVEGRVAPADERAWEFRDPALLTWEIERLSNWLDALASGAAVEDGEDFLHYPQGVLRVGITAALVLRRRRGDGRPVGGSSLG
jgi:hypothetical protein